MTTIRYIKDENENIVLPITHERGVIDSQGNNLETKLAGKQSTLISGESIKTINNESILGNGNITVQTSITTDATPTSGSTNPVQSGGVYTALSTKYEWPSGGIPSTDMTSAVQTSLGKADTAYQKPGTGIPSTDMTTAVQTSLSKANTALQSHQDISGKEDKTNKVTSLSSSSNNTQYPSALCVYNLISGLTSPFTYAVASELPSAGSETMGVIYVITDGTDTDFYITVEDSDSYSWEQIGTLDTSFTTITNGEIDALFV